ncbi:MAG TPA: hypothetical protein VNN10_08685 [Dehalococcoidia bacterium]|nr:hypothetical protein [Dehalococcoidia bacterium]
MPLRLKLDPRPPLYDSVAEAVIADDEGQIEDDVEHAHWSPLAPPPPAAGLRLAFVDGVERRERRLSAEGEGRFVPGLLASYAAGAVWPGRRIDPSDVRLERRLIIGCGERCPSLVMKSATSTLCYTSVSSPESDFEGLGRVLNHLRADMEASLVRRLVDAGAGLIVVDGRLPPDVEAPAVGLIKTPHVLPSVVARHFDVLSRLRAGERSPVFVRRRSDRAYYCWFLCLRRPAASEVALSGLALLELSGSTPKEEAVRLADLSAAHLPAFASQPYQDDRAPQNLLPVGLLESHLRHLLGNPDLLHRLAVETFAAEEIWL